MAQWVKNLTAVAQVAADARVQSLAGYSRLKDPAELRLRFSRWPKKQQTYAVSVA